MSTTATDRGPLAVLERLRDAINAHDLDAMVACFADDFRGETPTFPDNSFVGNEPVRENWSRILARVRDLHYEILRAVVDRDTVWAEIEQTGTDTDGTPHHLRGVVIHQVDGDVMTHNRLYVTPVLGGKPGIVTK